MATTDWVFINLTSLIIPTEVVKVILFLWKKTFTKPLSQNQLIQESILVHEKKPHPPQLE